MELFLSHFVNRFDAKGRISVPAPFRAVLAKDGFEGVFAHPALDAPALDCGGKALLNEIDALLESMPPYSREREDLATALLGASEILRLDSEGRIVLGERLRASLGADRRGGCSSARATSFRSGSRTVSPRISRRPRLACGGCGRNSASRRGGGRMKAGRGEDRIAAGGPARHVPVLLAETLGALAPRAGGVYRRRHLRRRRLFARAARTRRARRSRSTAIPRAIAGGAALVAEFAGRLTLVEGRFAELDAIARGCGFDAVDGVALDIGVSSMQLDEAERGFSLRFDAPLDMRMEGKGRSAADILREDDEATIADILFYFGEERAARRIARAIVADRKTCALRLDAAARRDDRARRAGAAGRSDPSGDARLPGAAHRGQRRTRRVARGLAAAERMLAPGGRLAVVTFHSLEDRIVKQFLARRAGRGRAASRLLPGEPAPPRRRASALAAGQPIAPGAAEIAANPRARSAKLRFAERTDAPPQATRRRDRGADAAAVDGSGRG